MNSANSGKRLITGGTAALLIFSGAALADDHMEAAIEYPAADQVVYTNSIELLGYDKDAADNRVQWAVRLGTCAASTNTVAGNVDGYDDPFLWKEGEFGTSVDATGWVAGQYCFVLNTTAGEAEGSRLTQAFYLVDEFAKVGGTIGMGKQGRGNSPTHTFDGVVGYAGEAVGAVGSIDINYRSLGEHCTLSPRPGLNIGETAPGIGVTEPVRANGTFDNSCGGTADVWILGRGSSNDAYPRGAIVVWPDQTDYERFTIDLEPDIRQPESNWYPMERGNNEVGVR